MSCNKSSVLCASSARKNGVARFASQAAGQVSSWGFVARVFVGLKADEASGEADKMPGALHRVADAGLSMIGLGLDENNKVRFRNIAGVIMAVHGAEYLTGTLVTAFARSAIRGKPYGRYRGVILRKNPLAAQLPAGGRSVARSATGYILGAKMGLMRRGRMNAADGYYFHADGTTWSVLTADYRMPSSDTGEKTFSVLRSLNIPYRAYYFDRRIDERDAVDMALGDLNPDTLPGFLGETNEIDCLIGTGVVKRGLIHLGWTSMDDTERDARTQNRLDYETLNTDWRATSLTDYTRIQGDDSDSAARSRRRKENEWEKAFNTLGQTSPAQSNTTTTTTARTTSYTGPISSNYYRSTDRSSRTARGSGMSSSKPATTQDAVQALMNAIETTPAADDSPKRQVSSSMTMATLIEMGGKKFRDGVPDEFEITGVGSAKIQLVGIDELSDQSWRAEGFYINAGGARMPITNEDDQFELGEYLKDRYLEATSDEDIETYSDDET